MKNLPVGKKILIGFGSVILLVVGILAVNTVTSVTRERDLARAETMNALQLAANNMLDELHKARYASATAFTAVNDDASYQACFNGIDAALGHLDELEGHAAALGGYNDEKNAQLRVQFNSFRQNVQAVQANDDVLTAQLANMTATSQALAATATDLVTMVEELTLNLSQDDAALLAARMRGVIIPAQGLNEHIDAMRIRSSELIIGMDDGVAPELHTMLDEIQQEANAVRAVLTTDEARTAVDSMLAAIEEYRSALTMFVDTIHDSDRLVGEANQTMEAVTASVTEGVAGVSADVASQMAGTVSDSARAMWVMLGIGLAVVLASGAIALFLGKQITRPLGKMKAVMVQAGETGDLNFTEQVRDDVLKEAQAKDELGQSMLAFAHLIDRIRYIATCLEAVAGGDLTQDVTLLTEQDTMGTALQTMNNNLNGMFAEINQVASQVASGAGEIATGAQSLAQGSTEQASTVEEISASISEISEQAGTSVQTAQAAAADGAEIKNIALDGNEKMKSMMKAVQEINEASQSIGQVIKVIDDIAFQTNILALNAAVEAARAGEHGKGFAVVADEVRNLAGKSADAAKETAALISANIEKAELGLAISQETAQSLDRIVEGIQRTSDSLATVAQQSEGTSTATSQVNAAVDQVAQVVQQNSATSEESAAASEEMSSQAQVLQQLIARFKLRGGPAHGTGGALPPTRPQGPAPGGDDAPAKPEDIIF